MGDQEKCPFCGMEDNPCSSQPQDHCCWVGKFAKELKGLRSIYCYEREIADLKERLEAWRGLRPVTQSYGLGPAKIIMEPKDHAVIQKLRELKEIE